MEPSEAFSAAAIALVAALSILFAPAARAALRFSDTQDLPSVGLRLRLMSGNREVPAAPPIAEKRQHSFTYHGITIEDPYHWLKDQSYSTVDDEDVLDYVKAENALLHGVQVSFFYPLSARAASNAK